MHIKSQKGFFSGILRLGLAGDVVFASGSLLKAIAMGIFGYGEIISDLGEQQSECAMFTAIVSGLRPTKQDCENKVYAFLRGAALGSVLGILPGGGAVVAAFAACALENKASLNPGEVLLGKVNIRVVALPESGNNAGAQTVSTPQLALRMPPNIVMALMAGL